MLEIRDITSRVNCVLLELEEIPYILRVASVLKYADIDFKELLPVDIVTGRDVEVTDKVLEDIDFIFSKLEISYEIDYNDALKSRTIIVRG